MTRQEMLTQLRENTCRVKFTKVNGEERDMRCTLLQKLIPSDQMPKGSTLEESNKSEDVIRVFDVTANGWRSFKVDNVIEFNAE